MVQNRWRTCFCKWNTVTWLDHRLSGHQEKTLQQPTKRKWRIARRWQVARQGHTHRLLRTNTVTCKPRVLCPLRKAKQAIGAGVVRHRNTAGDRRTPRAQGPPTRLGCRTACVVHILAGYAMALGEKKCRIKGAFDTQSGRVHLSDQPGTSRLCTNKGTGDAHAPLRLQNVEMIVRIDSIAFPDSLSESRIVFQNHLRHRTSQ